MTKQRATFSSFCNGSEACRGSGCVWRCSLVHAPARARGVNSTCCCPFPDLYSFWGLPVLWQRVLSPLHGLVGCSPSSSQLSEAQSAPESSKGCRRGGEAAEEGSELCLVPPAHGQGGFLKQRAVNEGLHNSPKWNFINLLSVKSRTAHLVLDISS